MYTMCIMLKNNKARSIWQKLSAKKSFNTMVNDYRKTFSIPEDGFENEIDYKKWLADLIKNKKLNLKSLELMAKIRSRNWGFDISSLDYVIYDFIHYGKVKNFRLDSASTTGCDMYLITPRNRAWIKNELKDGIYLKIGESSRPTDINLFLKQEKGLIESFQKVFTEMHKNKVVKTKYKQSTNIERDSLVYLYGQMKIKELNKISGSTSTYKDLNISTIMRKRGFNIEPENVRQIIHRQNKSIRDK